VRDRLMFDADWMLDWDYTAENKLLFRRGRYNTVFYRWVGRWLHEEWEDAWRKAGRPYSLPQKAEIFGKLWLYRAVVNLLARMPSAAIVQFQPAEGR
jgi:hypothetical protein